MPNKILTGENYYDADEYMSVSQYKAFNNCEVDALFGKQKTSTALLVGSYVDAFVEGALEEFKTLHPEIFTARGELRSDYKQADEICEYISRNDLIKQFLSGEKQTIMTGNIDGVPFKIKMDSYIKGVCITDLKCMRTVTQNGEFYDFITPWGYNIQGACYQEIVYQNTGERLPFYICAVTKETPINSVIIKIPQYVLDSSLEMVKSNINHIYSVKKGEVQPIGCGKCATCISKRKTPIISLEELLYKE